MDRQPRVTWTPDSGAADFADLPELLDPASMDVSEKHTAAGPPIDGPILVWPSPASHDATAAAIFISNNARECYKTKILPSSFGTCAGRIALQKAREITPLRVPIIATEYSFSCPVSGPRPTDPKVASWNGLGAGLTPRATPPLRRHCCRSSRLQICRIPYEQTWITGIPGSMCPLICHPRMQVDFRVSLDAFSSTQPEPSKRYPAKVVAEWPEMDT